MTPGKAGPLTRHLLQGSSCREQLSRNAATALFAQVCVSWVFACDVRACLQVGGYLGAAQHMSQLGSPGGALHMSRLSAGSWHDVQVALQAAVARADAAEARVRELEAAVEQANARAGESARRESKQVEEREAWELERVAAQAAAAVATELHAQQVPL